MHPPQLIASKLGARSTSVRCCRMAMREVRRQHETRRSDGQARATGKAELATCTLHDFAAAVQPGTDDALLSAMTRRVRTFGRAKLSFRMRLLQLTLARLYGAGWPAAVARRLGLQPDPTLRTHTFRLPGRTPSAPPLRVGFATDFHSGPTTHPAVVERACRVLADAKPDVLLLAGDFIELHARHVDRLMPMIAMIPAPLGCFAVLGNHDLMGDDAYVAHRLESAGVQLLTNRSARLPPPHDDVWLCGLDDPTRGVARADCALDGVPGARVVLMHSPDGLLTIGERPFDLALCGHTHGGQIALPTGHALYMPEGDLNRLFPRGLYQLQPDGRRTMLVSSGVGCSTVPVRLFAQPEVHICTLIPTDAPSSSALHSPAAT